MRIAALVVILCAAHSAAAAQAAVPGAAMPANLREVMAELRRDGPDIELLLSYGTSKGASAGHLALAVSGPAPGDARVYSANFYADRAPKHAAHFHTDDLILRVPKTEYLYGTSSTLGSKASFGLDFGETYKRTVTGVRIFGVPAGERDAVARYLERINADFHARTRDTEYHRGEVRYDYMNLNCAKTIGAAFHYGAGYRDVALREAPVLGVRKVAKALNANTPSELAMQLLRAFAARGYRMDVVVYRKHPSSPYVDPHADEPVAFKDLPDRFPSVISLDFRNDANAYEDYDNLYALALLRNLTRHEVAFDGDALVLRSLEPMAYGEAARAAAASAEADSKPFLKRVKRSTP